MKLTNFCIQMISNEINSHCILHKERICVLMILNQWYTSENPLMISGYSLIVSYKNTTLVWNQYICAD